MKILCLNFVGQCAQKFDPKAKLHNLLKDLVLFRRVDYSVIRSIILSIPSELMTLSARHYQLF